jgi:hypothetical protein
MRHLAALSDVLEVASDQYIHSRYSRELAKYPLVDAFKYMYDHAPARLPLPHELRTDGLAVSTITSMYGEILQSGLQREAGNIQMMRETRLHRPLGTYPIPLSSSILHKIQRLVQGLVR